VPEFLFLDSLTIFKQKGCPYRRLNMWDLDQTGKNTKQSPKSPNIHEEQLSPKSKSVSHKIIEFQDLKKHFEKKP